MRTRAIITSTLASLGVLVVGWQAGTAVIADSATTPTSTTASGTGSGSAASDGSAAGSTTTTDPATTDTPTPTATTESSAAASTDGTYTGAAYSTRWGDVQVSVTISGGAITEVTALQLTDADGKSVQISNRAAPILRDEVIAAQSASVSNVSGATYTTQAYLSSVQSALDQAGF